MIYATRVHMVIEGTNENARRRISIESKGKEIDVQVMLDWVIQHIFLSFSF